MHAVIGGDIRSQFGQHSQVLSAVVSTDAFKAGMAKLSVNPTGESPEEFAQLIKSDFDRWGPIVQASGFAPED